MGSEYWVATFALAVALVAVLTKKNALRWALVLGGVVAVGYFFATPLSPGVEHKGLSGRQGAFIALMFVLMLIGMGAQYFFYRKKNAPFSWNEFLKPALASPLVFMPLLGSLEEANLNVDDFSVARLMLLFVAFQNGFLWRNFFETQVGAARSEGNDA